MLTYIATIDPELMAGFFLKLTRPNVKLVDFKPWFALVKVN